MRKSFVLMLFMVFSIFKTINAQNESYQSIGEEETNTVIDSISKLMEKYYVSLETAKKINQLILANSEKDVYKKLTDPVELAFQLTADLRSVNGDLHLNVSYNKPQYSAKEKEQSSKVDRKGQWTNYGFQEIKFLEGNIGYLKISHFTNWDNFEEAKKAVTNSFNALQNVDALLIDVRDNSGGFEEIVAYTISHLFDGEPIHLSDYYYCLLYTSDAADD